MSFIYIYIGMSDVHFLLYQDELFMFSRKLLRSWLRASVFYTIVNVRVTVSFIYAKFY